MPEVLSLYEVQFVKKFGTQKLKKSGAQWLHGVVGGGVCCNTSRSNQFFQVQLIIRSPVACSARDSSKAELSPKFISTALALSIKRFKHLNQRIHHTI